MAFCLISSFLLRTFLYFFILNYKHNYFIALLLGEYD